jgi:dihydropyrimidinase
VTLTADIMHDNVGYTPYEGRVVKGWPVTVVSRGRVVIEGGALHAARGCGQFIPRGVSGPVSLAHKPSPGAECSNRCSAWVPANQPTRD